VFPGKGAIHLANQTQTGKWSDIGTGPAQEVSLDVFSLWVDHGREVSDAAYAYVVYPGVSVEVLRQRVDDSAFEVLANAPQLQAVGHAASGLTQAAFYEAGTLDYGDGRFMRIDQPCLVMFRDMGQSVQLAVSNPLNEPLRVNVETDLAFKGEGCAALPDGGTRIALTLPDEATAGSSLVRTFVKADPASQ
jgi:chondroitin AC lyase